MQSKAFRRSDGSQTANRSRFSRKAYYHQLVRRPLQWNPEALPVGDEVALNQPLLQVDPGTLFLNDAGGPLRSLILRTMVSELTLRYGGKIVTPHLFRDIFAFMWLELNPQDYLTLSKLLCPWQRAVLKLERNPKPSP